MAAEGTLVAEAAAQLDLFGPRRPQGWGWGHSHCPLAISPALWPTGLHFSPSKD